MFGGEIKKNDGGVNSPVIYCKTFCRRTTISKNIKNSKWIISLNVKCKTMKFLEGNFGEIFCNLGLVNF
jgi:isocitrate dehydrogenase